MWIRFTVGLVNIEETEYFFTCVHFKQLKLGNGFQYFLRTRESVRFELDPLNQAIIVY